MKTIRYNETTLKNEVIASLPVILGGTGQTSYVIGDILYANTSTSLSSISDVATGNVLISGGVGVAPSYGKINLITHVSPLTASRALASDASGFVSVASTTLAELNFVSGVTSAIQTQFTGKASTGAIISNGNTMTTARILGRTTAASGPIEEITIGTGLSLSAGSLSCTVTAGQAADAGLTSLAALTGAGVVTATGTDTFAMVASVPATQGGTGQTTYTVGDILVGGAANTLSKLADVATGNVLISGGVGVAPSYGKIDLTTHVTALTASRAAATNASGFLSVATTTLAELNFVSGVTSAIQTQFTGKAATGAITSNGSTMTTARMLGRTTAATGAIEEITIGTGLSLSAGALTCTVTAGQAADAGLTSLAGLTGAGIVSATGTDTFAMVASVPATQGGTGQTTYAVGDLLIGGATNTLNKLADVATGNVLIAGGVGVAPSYGKVGLGTHVTALTASRAAVTDASGFVTTSSVTSTEVGYLSGVTSAIQTQINAKGTGTITALTGDVTASGTGSVAATIAANAVTLSKMADVATDTVFYRKTAGTGDPEVQTIATLKTDLGLTGTNTGDQTITLTGDITGSGTSSFGTTLATVNSNVGSFGSATQTSTFTTNAKGLITAAGSVIITPAFSSITSKPTTLSGYGITDAALSGAVTATGITMSTARILGRTTAATGAIEEISIGSGLSLSAGTLSSTISQGITALTGDVTASGTGSVVATLQTVNSNVGSFGSSTQVGTFTVNGKGLITAAGSANITPAFSSITSKPTTLSGYGITDSALNGTVISTGITMVSAKMLGRTTAGTGAIEEITVGTGLALSAGSLICTVTAGQAADAGLTSLAGLTGAGIVTATGTDTFAMVASVPATQGGTGFTTIGVGDLVVGAATNTMTKLADVATGNVLITGGVGVAPSYGKIGLGTHVTALTASRAAVTDASGFVTASSVTSTEVGYLSGVTSAIQSQINGLVPLGSVITGGQTMSTARMLGRSTAAAGPIEEITIGTGLALSAGSLTCTVTAGQAVDAGLTSLAGLTGAGIVSATGTDTFAMVTSVPATQGGTGQTTYAVGDLLIGGATNTLNKLADVATGNVLISGGVGVAPSYNKINFLTHVSGIVGDAIAITNVNGFITTSSVTSDKLLHLSNVTSDIQAQIDAVKVGASIGGTATVTITTGTAALTPGIGTAKVWYNPATAGGTVTIRLPSTSVDGTIIRMFVGGTIAVGTLACTSLSIQNSAAAAIFSSNFTSFAAYSGDVYSFIWNTDVSNWCVLS